MTALSRRAQLCIFCLALCVRLAHAWAMSQSPYFDHPVIDAETYDTQARKIAAGQGHPDKVFWQPPGYAYWLALLQLLCGTSFWIPRIAQSLLGAATAVLTARLGARLFGVGVGLASGLATALYSMLFYFDSELLPPTPTIFLQLCALLIAQQAMSPTALSLPRWLAAGVCAGLSGLLVAPSLLLAPLLALFARRRFFVPLIGTALAVAPVTLRNYLRGQELVLVSFNGGSSLFIGNNPKMEQTINIRPGREWERFIGEPARLGITGCAPTSAYFTAKVLEFARREPLAFAGLQLKKLGVLLDGGEVPRNHAIYPSRAQSRLLRWLLFKVEGLAFPWGLLLPLALLGLCTSWREARLLASFLVLYSLVTVAFFVTARYRVPLVPGMIVFAAAGVRNLRRPLDAAPASIRNALFWKKGVPVLLALLAFLWANLHQGQMPREMNADAQYSLGVRLAKDGRVDEAMARYRAALRLNPAYPEAWANLGAIHAERHQYTEAERHLRKALALDPRDAGAHINLGNIRFGQGRPREAIALFEKALTLEPGNTLARENLQRVERAVAGRVFGAPIGLRDLPRTGGPAPDAARMGEWLVRYRQTGDPRLLGNLIAGHELRNELDQAITTVRQALVRVPQNAELRFTLGRLLARAGQLQAARLELRAALKLGDPRVRGWIARNNDVAGLRAELLAEPATAAP